MNEGRFYGDLSEAICERSETCYTDVYDAVFGGGRCLEEFEEEEEEWLAFWEDCEFDSSAAGECLDVWQDITCSLYPTGADGYEICSQVYDCP
jgi:hypothetical protein